jgi:hypothetical protein
MRITVERSGGVAGLIRRQEVDTSRLPAGDAKRLTALAASVGRTPAAAPGAPPQADRFVFSVTIEDGGKARSHTLSEAGLSKDWQALLDEIRKLAG